MIEGWSARPRFLILLHGGSGHAKTEFERSTKSIEAQIYPFWTVREMGSHIDRAVVQADADYIVPLRVGDMLANGALFRFAQAIQARNHPPIVYADHDHLDHRGKRSRPWFKPEWNEEMFLAQDYLSAAVAIEMQLARQAAEAGNDLHNLLLAATTIAADNIVHIPHVITHVATAPHDQKGRLRAVARHVEPLGASCGPGAFGTVKVTWPLPADPPQVSIIVPTRDKVDLLRQCVRGLFERTDYPNYEIIIVDNGSVEQATRDYLASIADDPRVRIIAYPGSYNYSSINNFAAQTARGSFLCLLNNDTEVLESAWLTEMMRYAVSPKIGAVGAKLLYEDRSIQHAGIVVGMGGAAGHAHRFLPAGEPGYFLLPHVPHFVSAVTGACLVVEKSKYDAVGGLDEDKFAVAFNDVDFCLKLPAAGWRNVYVPHAVLLHYEARSRGNDMSAANIDRYTSELLRLQERWGTKTHQDPLHNPNLDPHSETFVLRLTTE